MTEAKQTVINVEVPSDCPFQYYLVDDDLPCCTVMEMTDEYCAELQAPYCPLANAKEILVRVGDG